MASMGSTISFLKSITRKIVLGLGVLLLLDLLILMIVVLALKKKKVVTRSVEQASTHSK